MSVPEELFYTRTHEWMRREGDVATVGITDHAQTALGDVVFVELPEVGREVGANEACAVVESVKAASDVYAPVAGVVAAVNDKLVDAPETINADPYGEGWLVEVTVDGDGDPTAALLDAEAYQALVDAS